MSNEWGTLIVIVAAIPALLALGWWDQILALWLEKRMSRREDTPARRR